MSIFFLAVLVVLGIATGLMFAAGAGLVALIPVVLLVVAALWFLRVLVSGRTPRVMLRQTHKAELLGPGGPDDPESGA